MRKMKKQKFKALITDNFYDRWIEIVANDESLTINEAKKIYDSEGQLKKLHQRIAGQTVVMIEHPCINPLFCDYYEEIDKRINSFHIYPELFVKID